MFDSPLRTSPARLILCLLTGITWLHGNAFAQEDEPVEIQAEAVQQVLQGEMIEIVDFLGNGPGDPVVAKGQFLKEMESLVRLELGFAFRVCEWSDEEKFAIRAAVKEQSPSLADMMIGVNGGRVAISGDTIVANTPSGAGLNANPYVRIEELVTKVMKELAPAEKLAQYQAECKLRDQFRREAAVGIVLNILDRKLALTQQQYQVLHEKLMVRWNKAINVSVEMYQNNPEYVPQLPAAVMQKELDQNQRTIWGTLSKYDFPMQMGSLQMTEANWDE
jgi:hypothetical protein